jgi:hypothetical protein
MSPIFRSDRVGEDPADTGHRHQQSHGRVVGTQVTQLELERVGSGRQVVDQGQALHEVRLPRFRQGERVEQLAPGDTEQVGHRAGVV